jgi:beta-glucosidase/6-phospho-beta-glucosidase/beta-galactosidase
MHNSSTEKPDRSSLLSGDLPPGDPESARTVIPAPLRPGVSQLFRSFWIGGFESASHINKSGARIDMVSATQHDSQVDEDYARLKEWGIQTVREGVRWHLVETARGFDFRSLRTMLEAARRHRIQVIWALCHYGWPDDLDILTPGFIDRFARYCGQTARFIADHSEGIQFYTPVNEISFLAWAAGEKAYFHPYREDVGAALKHQLIRATIAGIEAIWAVDPTARIMHTEPLIHVLTPKDRPDLARAAADQNAAQFEAWDMLGGAMEPQLGGHPRYLDIVGVNYYHANQWEHPDRRLRWEDSPRDPRWLPFSSMLADVYYRYWRPVVVSETSHFGSGRGRWISEVSQEVAKAREAGVGVEGLCVYPIIDRPDWEDPNHWHQSGLWELQRDASGRLRRVLCEEYAEALRLAQIATSVQFPRLRGAPR